MSAAPCRSGSVGSSTGRWHEARALDECMVVVTSRSFGLDEPGLRKELERRVAEVRYVPGPLSASQLEQAVVEADGLIAGLDEVNAQVLASAQHLRVVARYGVGVDRVDLNAAARSGVYVTTTPGANANAVAELTIALLLVLARSLVQGHDRARSGKWPAMRGVELSGKTLGLVGIGRIGSLVAQKASALGMHVVAHDPWVHSSDVAQIVDLSIVNIGSDFVSLHAPLTDETRGMIDRQFLEQLKPGAALVNTARGELVQENALLWALDHGHLRAAALDVLAEEPPPPGHPLLCRDDVIVTPHMAPHTTEATGAMGRMALDELLTVLSGHTPRFAVAVPIGGAAGRLEGAVNTVGGTVRTEKALS